MEGSPQGESAPETPDPTFRHEMPPRAEAVTGLVDGLEAFAEGAGLSARATGRLVVVVEELAANVAMHAAGATFLRVSARRVDGAVHLTLEDDGPAFDPLSAAPPDLDAALEDREVGGLGVHFVRTMARDVAYRRDVGLNRLTATLDAA